MIQPAFKFSASTVFIAVLIFGSSLAIGFFGFKDFVAQRLDLIATPAVITTTSFFDDYDNLTYVDQPSLDNLTWDGTGAIVAAAAPVGAADPVVLWRFDGNGNDDSGNNYHGSLTGGTDCSVAGQFNQACLFAAAGDAIAVPSLSVVNVGSLTVTGWVNRVGTAPAGNRYSIIHGAISGGNDEVIRIQINDRNQLRVENDFGALIICNSAIPENTWTHVGYTLDGLTARAYLNGSECGTATGTAIPVGSPAAQNFIGARSNPSEHNFSGRVDEIAIWNRALSASEINQIRQSGVTLGGGGTGPSGGSFRSAAINSGAFDQLTADWTATPSAIVTMSFSTDNGTNWCPVNLGQTLTSSPCFGGDTLKYRATFTGAGSLSSVNFSWVLPASVTNQPPTVEAGPNQTVTLPNSITLNGLVSDDGLPAGGTIVNTWSQSSGPGVVTFVNANAVSTTATFSASGTYVLRLTANDGLLTNSDEVTVSVNSPAVGAVVPSLVPTRTTCVAPCAIWFDASGTTQAGANANDVRLALDYNYNYGDSGAGNWTRGALARNGNASPKNTDRDTGVVGFHVYEQPGTYTATLNVGGATRSVQINVTSANTQWSGTNTVCVYTNAPAPVAGQGGCPTGAAVLQATGANPLSSAILTLCNGQKRCLFRRGETYNSGSLITLPSGPKYFGAYGSGPKPVWQDTAVAPNNTFIRFSDNGSDFQFVDLDVRGKADVINSPSGAAFNASNSDVINRALWLRTNISRFDVALYAHCNNYPACNLDADDVHHQIAFVDSTAQYGPGAQPNSSGLGNIYITAKYFSMAGSISGDDLAGSVVTNGMSGSSFNGRFKYIDKGYIAHNEWGLLNPGADPLGVAGEVIGCGHEYEAGTNSIGTRGGGILSMRNGLNIGATGDYPSQDEMFVDNYVSACKYTQTNMTGFQQTDCTAGSTKEWHRYSRMTGNLFSSATSARPGSTIRMVLHGKAQGLLMSNNVFDGTRYTQHPNPNDGSASSATAITVEDCSSTQSGPEYHAPTDWRIYNNSFVVGAPTVESHGFLGSQGSASLTSNLKFDNNLYYDADGSGSMPSSFAGMTFCGSSNGPGSCNLKTSTNPWIGSWPFTNIGEFALVGGGSPGANIGLAKAEVPRDIFGNTRAAPHFAGAAGLGGVIVPTTPTLTVTPATLNFTATVGGPNPAPATLAITNTGNGTLNWSSTDNANWLTVSPTSGTGGATVTVTPNFTGLAAGAYSANLVITATGANGSPATVTVTATIVEAPVANSEGLGFNLGHIRSTETQIIFVDLFKQSGFRDSHPWTVVPSTANVSFNSMGYPVLITAPTSVYTDMVNADGNYPAGVYTLKFDGDGRVVLSGDGTGDFNQTSGTGTYTFNVNNPSPNGLRLSITRSSATNPVRNIHVIMPGFASVYESQPFYPPLVNRLAGVKVLRFMDWLRTNSQLNGSWFARTTPFHASQTNSRGGAYEYVFALSNLVGADPWINIPHLADDTYIRELARLALVNLAPGRRIYVEYSNELWNGAFDQGQYTINQGLALGLDTNGQIAGRKFVAKRSAEIFRIFEEEFGSQSNRVIKVIGGQAGSANVASSVLNAFSQASINGVPINPTGVTATVLAIAPYFGGGSTTLADAIGNAGEIDTITVSQILDRLEAVYLPLTINQIMPTNKPIADQYGLTLVAYEGGSVLRANNILYQNNQTLTQKLIAANRDPRMYGIYESYLDAWRDLTSGIFIHYLYVDEPNQFGSWGALEHLNQPSSEAHKYRALYNYAGLPVPPASSTPVSGPILSVTPTTLNFTATVGGPNPAPATLAITNTGNGTLNWSSTDNANWLTVSPTSGTGGATVTVTPNFTGLAAGAYSANLVITATGANGSPATVTVTGIINVEGGVAGDITPPIISGVQVSNIGPTSAVITWSTNEPATGQVAYGLSTNYGLETVENTNPALTHSESLTSLSPNTTYHFQTNSHDVVGNSAQSIDFTFLTSSNNNPDSLPPDPINDLNLISVDRDFARLAWLAPADRPVGGMVSRYDLRVSQAPITESTWEAASMVDGEPIPSAPGTPEAYTVAGLLSGRTYYVAIRSIDASGENLSSPSNIVAFTTTNGSSSGDGSGGGGGGSSGSNTPRGVATQTGPTGLFVQGANQQAILRWQNPVDPGFLRVLVLRSSVVLPTITSPGNPRFLPGATAVYEGTASSFIDTGLTNGQNYYYTLYGYDHSGNYASPIVATVRPGSFGQETIQPVPNVSLAQQILELKKLLLNLLYRLLELLRAGAV